MVLLLLEVEAERESARLWLEEAGYEVVMAADGEDAARLIDQRLDLQVAVLEHGPAAEHHLLDRAAESPAGLEVVLGGQADVFAMTQGLAAGAVAFLPHPITQANLLSQVALAHHTAEQARRKEELALRGPGEVSFEGIVGVTPA